MKGQAECRVREIKGDMQDERDLPGKGAGESMKNLVLPDNTVVRTALCMACVVIVVAGMKAAAPLLNMIFLGWLLAQAISPFLLWMIAKRVPSNIAIGVSVVAMSGVSIGVASLLGYSISGLIRNLPAYQTALMNVHASVMGMLEMRGVETAGFQPVDIFNLEKAFPYIQEGLRYVGQFIGNTILILVIAAVLLYEFGKPSKIEKRLSISDNPVISFVHDASRDMKRFIILFGGAGLVQALAYFLILLMVGVDYAIVWAGLFFITNFIPGVGCLLAALPPILISLLDLGPKAAVIVAVSYLAVNALFDYIIKPKLIGVELDISIFLILMSVIFWTWVLGPAGTILAVPLTLFIKNLLDAYSRQNAIALDT